MLVGSPRDRLTIIGAGPVGLLLAIYLADRGYGVDIYEKRQDPRLQQVLPGRSINLALSARGLSALREVDMEGSIIAQAVRMKGRQVHEKDLTQHFIPYSPRERDAIYSISRMELTKLLLEKAESYSLISIRFNQECLGVEPKSQILILKDRQTLEKSEKKFSVLFDAEGIWSAARTSLLGVPHVNFSQQYLPYDYKELTIPAVEGKYAFEMNAFHLWPRGEQLLIALPNSDGSFTCTLFFEKNKKDIFDSRHHAYDFLRSEFYDALQSNEHLPDELVQHPTGRLATIQISSWAFPNNILLVGDAAHGIVPFYGQGLNCSFEDCSVLIQCLDEFDGDWGKAFKKYENCRRPNAEAIAELSLDNFIELREKVTDPLFRLKRDVENILETKYPHDFYSKYSMVTFSRMPYTEALTRGRWQDQILMEACAKAGSIDKINFEQLKAQLEFIE